MVSFNKILSHRRKLALLTLFVGLAAFSFASMGGGGGKAKTSASLVFSPIKSKGSFTLKAGPSYRTNIFNEAKAPTSYFNFNSSLITYQKGNTTYILPRNSRISLTAGKSNLQVVNLKVNILR